MLNELSSISIEELANTCINTIKSNIISLRKLNILILGKSGVGKSTLINSVFREELTDTGIGRPVTPKIREIKKEGFPLTIYDTKGLELGKEAQDEVKEEVAELIKEGLYSADVNKCIHCIWYCINTMSNRVEPEEIEWIKSLSNSSDINKVPIIVILTNSVFERRAEEMKKVIVEENLPIKSVVSVLAQDYIEDEKVFKSNGLDTLINVMAQVLPDELQNTLQNVQKASLKHKRKLADKAVTTAAASAVATGVTPIPFADSMVLIPIQITMMASITAIYGIEVDKALLATFVSSVLGTGGATIAGKTIVSNLLKLVPGLGSVAGGLISGGTAGALTTALGKAYIKLIEMVYKGEFKSSDLNTELGKEKMKEILKAEKV